MCPATGVGRRGRQDDYKVITIAWSKISGVAKRSPRDLGGGPFGAVTL